MSKIVGNARALTSGEEVPADVGEIVDRIRELLPSRFSRNNY
ncbi:hypothetical protein QUB60_16965 [Microcoleus sp. A2-C5]|nr:hypothetical protein [Lyngbya sp. CCAP 1446/10]